MAKYIDADKLKNTLKKNIYPSSRCGKTFNSLLEFVMRLIDDMPTADVVSTGVLAQVQWERDVAIDQLNSYGVGFAEKADVVRVVRCKDCVHCVVREYDIIDELECEFFDVFTNPLDYCSRGERKADNEI